MSMLDEWEADTNQYRIKTLIDLVRKKDEALSTIVAMGHPINCLGMSLGPDACTCIIGFCQKALNLTEQLK